MKSSKFFAVTAFAALAAAGAHAGEADLSTQFAQHIDSTRTRAEVRVEGVQKARNPGFEPAGSRVAARVQSSVPRATVRAETKEAVRLGQIVEGEANFL